MNNIHSVPVVLRVSGEDRQNQHTVVWEVYTALYGIIRGLRPLMWV